MTMGNEIHPDQKEDHAAHIAVHAQAASGIKQLVGAGQVKSQQEGQLMLRAIQLIEAHIAETAAFMDESGQLRTSIEAGQKGTPAGGGRLRTDVQQQGAGQGAQPDNLRQGSQQSNALRPGTGSAFVSKVAGQTGG